MPEDRFLIDDGIIAWFDGPEWDQVAMEAFQDASNDVKQEAQDNAPWEDQTGDARSGLDTAVENDHGEIVLTLFHTVEYGLWLEVIQNGRFAIIMPTLEHSAPKIFQNAEARVASARQGDNF